MTFYGQRSVMAAWATRSPWSNIYKSCGQQPELSTTVLCLSFFCIHLVTQLEAFAFPPPFTCCSLYHFRATSRQMILGMHFNVRCLRKKIKVCAHNQQQEMYPKSKTVWPIDLLTVKYGSALNLCSFSIGSKSCP